MWMMRRRGTKKEKPESDLIGMTGSECVPAGTASSSADSSGAD